MARQAVPSSRTQSAPINITYSNQDDQEFWRYQYHHNQNQEDEEEEEEQNHHETEEDQLMMMQNGFSGGVIDMPEERTTADEGSDADDVNVYQPNAEQVQVARNNDNLSSQNQKFAVMDDDLLEQLLAENESKLRQMIRYVENVNLVFD